MRTLPARERFTTLDNELLASLHHPVGHEGRYLAPSFTVQEAIPFISHRKHEEGNIWLLPGLGISHDSPIYQRSNEQISKDAYQRIEQHPLLETSCIDLNIEQGKVTIDGTVETLNLKEMLEQTLYHISGVSYVDNRLRYLVSDTNESEMINNI